MGNLRNWAAGNYPAGGHSYNATPRAVAPAYDGLTPGVAAAAQEVNYLLQRVGQDAAAGAVSPGLEWAPFIVPSTVGSLTSFGGAYYIAGGGSWIVGCSASAGTGNSQVYSSQGVGDNDWAAVDNGTGITTCAGKLVSVIFDGTHYFAAIIKQSDSSINVFRCAGGGAWSSIFSDNTFVYKDAVLSMFGGFVILTTATNGTVSIVTGTSDSGATWGGSGGFGTVVATSPGMLFATNGTIAVAIPTITATGHYGTTSGDPTTTWTQRNMSFMVHSSETPRGLCYSAYDGAFVLVTSAVGAMHTYTSQDGITWAEVGTGVTTFTSPRGLAVTTDGVLTTWAETGSADIPLFSIDGGANWRTGRGFVALPGFTALTAAKMFAGDTGFFAMNNGFARFSRLAGLPAALT